MNFKVFWSGSLTLTLTWTGRWRTCDEHDIETASGSFKSRFYLNDAEYQRMRYNG